MRFFNTYSGKIESFHPLEAGRIKLYTCGPTVYNYAHIGNFRAYVFEDLLKRYLQFRGYKVLHVMNITDVDDKTIKAATDLGISLDRYTEKYIEAFFADIDALNLVPADHYPRATQHILEMVDMVQALLKKGYAYEKDGSYYFNIAKFPDYGRLSKIDLQELKPGARIDVDDYAKESVHDFALWKAAKPGEMAWETEIGTGRPGWHIECSVMSAKFLGESFDIHCGGVDNIFPHHENEIAQSEALSGKPFVRTWLHCHHLIVDGEKMSKSKGNQYTLADLTRKDYDPLDLRFLLLSTHYRKQLNFTFDALRQAAASRQRIKDFLFELQTRAFPPGENSGIRDMIAKTENDFTDALADDLNISAAISALFGLIKRAHRLINRNEIRKVDVGVLTAAIRGIDKVLGVLPKDARADLAQEIQEKIAEREKARAEKNYALADRIRNELLARGILLEDTKEGVRWKFIGRK